MSFTEYRLEEELFDVKAEKNCRITWASTFVVVSNQSMCVKALLLYEVFYFKVFPLGARKSEKKRKKEEVMKIQ